MNFIQSQQDMRSAYLDGASGVLASGLIWSLAALVGLYATPTASMATLFIGGMFIFPLGILFSKMCGATGRHSSANLLHKPALENLGILFGGLFIAFVMAQYNKALFYPVMLIVIGARYLTFQTLYGLKSYWLLGALLMVAGVVCTALSAPFLAGALLGATIEILFAGIIFKGYKKCTL